MAFAVGINQESLEQSIEDYKKIQLTPEQKLITETIANDLGEFLEIPEMVRKVLTWKSQQEWQLINNKTISDILDMPTNDRIVAVKELFNIGKKNLKDVLSNRKEQELYVDIAFEKAYKLYLIQTE